MSNYDSAKDTLVATIGSLVLSPKVAVEVTLVSYDKGPVKVACIMRGADWAQPGLPRRIPLDFVGPLASMLARAAREATKLAKAPKARKAA